MASIRTKFEKEIRGKLNQKASAKTSEEQILLKAFKYFDLNNSGDVTFDEFTKAVEKIGALTFSEQELQELFNFYDSDSSGSLDYKEFSGIVFGNASGVSKQLSPGKDGKATDVDDIQVLLEKLKKVLAGRGPGGILGLGRQFKIADKNGNRELDPEEFKYALRDFGTGFKDDETAKLFEYFDRTRDGQVNFDEFIYAIRGQLNQFRKNLVLQAFKKIDRDASGELTVDDLVGVYNAKFHPEVKAGRKTEKQVLAEFLDTFHGMYDYHAIHDDKVTQDEFLEYYAFVSASIDNDQYFELMMNNAWRMNEGENKNWNTKGWAGNDNGTPAKNTKVDPRQKAGGREEPKSTGRPGTRGGDTQSNIFGGSVPQTSQGGSRQETSQSDTKKEKEVKALLKAFQEKILTRGARGLIGLQRLFKIIDDDNSKDLNRTEFSKAVKDFRLDFSTPEANKLFDYFDEDHSGSIDYDEFLRTIRGEMSDKRINLIKQAFKKFDRTGDGVVTIDDLRGVYSAKQHPDVKSGKKTEDDILFEFLDTFEQYHAIRHDDPKQRNKEVTLEEFIDYYRNVSCSIDSDEYFELMIKNAWNLDNKSYAKAWASKY
jgi:Ca2+-binding EF-hand superfamily protein